MKKKLPLLLLIALLTIAGQKSIAQGFYFGARGGMNVASLTQTPGDPVVRGNFGAFVGFQFGSIAGIQAEALYSFQGGYVRGASHLFDVQLDYIKIPLLAKIYLIKGLNVEGGISFNVLTSALVDRQRAKGYNSFDFSIPIGLAYQFGKHFELGMRYDISTAPYYPGRDGANSLFSVNVAWRF